MKKIIGAALGTCVHVGGLHNFLRMAESAGYESISLGPAIPPERLVEAIRQEEPEMVAVSYRLTPEVAASLFFTLKQLLTAQLGKWPRMVFGGTPPVADEARKAGIFEEVFDGKEPMSEIKAFLEMGSGTSGVKSYPSTLVERIAQKYPYPLLRHHYGRPTMQETVEGIRKIVMAGVVDVISLGPDQNAQAHFFEPEKMDPSQNGAGGVPVRTAEDLKALFEASRCGNYPLMRCYAGTKHLLQWASMSVESIQNAWAAIPLCWYSVMDGRSDRSLREAIAENQSVMRWYAQQGIPVEVNESHQWSLRDAHDALAVAMAYLAAYNARAMGVKQYVSQFMFNTPPGTSAAMDIAKMMAKRELIESLENEMFSVYREVRGGIAHFSPVPAMAKGQLAASAVISLAVQPHILHVVGFSEGDHAVTADELIESCQIVHGVLQDTLHGMPDMTTDLAVTQRKKELKEEAMVLIDALSRFPSESKDPLTDPDVIATAIEKGLLDAPHLRGNKFLRGTILTRLMQGAWYPIDPSTGDPLDELSRTRGYLSE